jgi:hypothetical protein
VAEEVEVSVHAREAIQLGLAPVPLLDPHEVCVEPPGLEPASAAAVDPPQPESLEERARERTVIRQRLDALEPAWHVRSLRKPVRLLADGRLLF